MSTVSGSVPVHASGPDGWPRSERAVVFALGLASMIVSMNLTLVVPILGLIQESLDTTAANAGWVTTATLLSAAVFTPVLGRLGDQHGRKPALVGVLVVLIVGSVLAATTHSLPWLITGRVLQGAATALFPLALSVLREEIGPRRLPTALAMASGGFAFGSGVGLAAAGLLTWGPDPDYRGVFWVATGAAVIVLVAVLTLVPATRHTIGGRTDVLGTLSLAAALVLLLLPVTQGHAWGWSAPITIGCFAGSVVMAAVWVLVERRVPDPLVDMRMFVHRPVLFANAAGFLVGYGTFALVIGVSYLVQTPPEVAGYGFGASVLLATVGYLLPSTVVSLLTAPVGGQLVRRFGPRVVLVLSSAFGTAGFVWLALDLGRAPSVIAGAALVGAAISLGYAAMPTIIVSGVPQHESGIANGLNSIFRSAGGAVGSAVIITVLAARSIEGSPAGAPALPAESQFTLSFLLAGGAFALITLVAFLGLRHIGVAGHHAAEAAPDPGRGPAAASPGLSPPAPRGR